MKPAKGDWLVLKDPRNRTYYGGVYKVVSVGRVNVKVAQDVRFSPTGPWFHQEHVVPLAHVERIVDASEVQEVSHGS